VQPATIYRQFGDMRGKLARESAADPVADLRAGWDAHIGFGPANPALYALMYGDPQPGPWPTAAVEAHNLLKGLVRRIRRLPGRR